MKKISKQLMKKICCFCIAIAMILSVAGSPVTVAYASELDDMVVSDDAAASGEDVIEEETDAKKGTPTDASMLLNHPFDETSGTSQLMLEQTVNGAPNSQMTISEPSLNGAPTDIEIDLIDITVNVPKSGEINPTPTFTNNGVGYMVEIHPRDGYSGWQDAGGNPISEYEKLTSANQLQLMFVVTPEPGYALTTTTAVAVNGSQADINLLGGDIPARYFDFRCYPQLEGTIDVIELSDVPTPVVGEKATAYSASGTNYSVTGAWYMYDAENKAYTTVDETHTFANGKTYKLVVEATADSGYEFSDDVRVNSNVDYYENSNEPVLVTIDYVTSFGTIIEKISVSEADIPKAQIGKAFEDKLIEIPVPAGSKYKIYGYWTDEDWNRSGIFQNGNAYEFNMEIYPEEGYYLSEDLRLYMDDEEEDIGYEPSVAYYTVRQSFATVIDKVYVKNLPTAAVGETIKKGEDSRIFEIEVPADANYTAFASWGLSNGDEMTEDTFQSGKSYELFVEFMPKKGYEFSENVIINDDGVDHNYNGASSSWASYVKTYSFRKVIDKLQVEGVKKPVVGQKATVDTIKVPDGANYVIASAEWLDYNTGEQVTTFENGHEYYLDILFYPKDGYEFELYADATVDGEDYSDRITVLPDVAYLSCCHTSFETLVSEVKVDNVPEMKLGEKAVVEATVPKDANYRIAYMTWYVWNVNKESFEEFGGTFEAGEVYRLSIYVVPKEGYEFDEAVTKVYVNGAADESIKAYKDGFDIAKTYTNGSKVIDRVEFTVTQPVVGHHSSIPPQISVPAGANYYVSQDNMPEWLFEKSGRYNSFYGYFDENTNYGADFMAVAKEGYVFAEDVVVVVNGVALSSNDIEAYSKEMTVKYVFGASCEHVYGDWSDAGDGKHVRCCQVCGHKDIEEHIYTDFTGTKCSVCGAVKHDPSPKTGDSSNMMKVFALMAMCGMGILVTDKRKKKAR